MINKLKEIGYSTLKNTQGGESSDYIYTSISANNDWMIKLKPSQKLIVHSDYLDSLRSGLEEHLKQLGKEYSDILLLPPSIKFIKEVELLRNFALEFGVQGGTLKEIEKFREELKKLNLDISYIALTINPLHYPIDIIGYAARENIKLIGLNSCGDDINRVRTIKSFTRPYLLAFSAASCDIVVTEWEDEAEWMIDLVGREVLEGCDLNRGVDKSIKELKPAIGTSISMGDSYIIPYNSPFALYSDVKIKLGEAEWKDIGEIGEEIDMIKTIRDYLKEMHRPEGACNSDLLALARYYTVDYLRKLYPKDWKESIYSIGDTIQLIEFRKERKKGLFKKIPGHIVRYSIILNPDKTFIFNQVENADEKE